MKFPNLTIALAVGSLAAAGVFLSQQSSCSNNPIGSAYQGLPRVEVHVVDSIGRSLPNLSVKLSGQPPQTTDSNGRISLLANSAGQRQIIPVKAEGYTESIAVIESLRSGNNIVQVPLYRADGQAKIPANVGGVVHIGSASVKIPGDIWVKKNGDHVYGDITVSWTGFNPHAKEQQAHQIPPTPMAAWTPSGEYSVFKSAAMGNLTAEQDGETLEPAPGQNVELTVTIAPELQSQYAVGSTIPMWSFDSTRGVWDYEGEGLVTEDKVRGKRVKGSFKHLSWKNYDDYSPSDCVILEVRDIGGTIEELSRLKAYISADAYAYHWSGGTEQVFQPSLTGSETGEPTVSACLNFPKWDNRSTKNAVNPVIKIQPLYPNSTRYDLLNIPIPPVSSRPTLNSVNPNDDTVHSFTSCEYNQDQAQVRAQTGCLLVRISLKDLQKCTAADPDQIYCPANGSPSLCERRRDEDHCGKCDGPNCKARQMSCLPAVGSPDKLYDCQCAQHSYTDPDGMVSTVTDTLCSSDGKCWNLQASPEHCGSCATPCSAVAAEMSCIKGKCECDAKDNKVLCDLGTRANAKWKCIDKYAGELNNDKTKTICGKECKECDLTTEQCLGGSCVPNWQKNEDAGITGIQNLTHYSAVGEYTQIVVGQVVRGKHSPDGTDDLWKSPTGPWYSGTFSQAWASSTDSYKGKAPFFITSDTDTVHIWSTDNKLDYDTAPGTFMGVKIRAVTGDTYDKVYAVGKSVSGQGVVFQCTKDCASGAGTWTVVSTGTRMSMDPPRGLNSASMIIKPGGIATEGLMVAVGAVNTIVFEASKKAKVVELADILDQDGKQLSQLTLNSVFLLNSGDIAHIYIAGEAGLILHATWNWKINQMSKFQALAIPAPAKSKALNSIWGYSSGNATYLFAVGTDGTALYSTDGLSWGIDSIALTSELNSVSGYVNNSTLNVNAVGSNSQMWRRSIVLR